MRGAARTVYPLRVLAARRDLWAETVLAGCDHIPASDFEFPYVYPRRAECAYYPE